MFQSWKLYIVQYKLKFTKEENLLKPKPNETTHKRRRIKVSSINIQN